jgi:hypothetical protein
MLRGAFLRHAEDLGGGAAVKPTTFLDSIATRNNTNRLRYTANGDGTYAVTHFAPPFPVATVTSAVVPTFSRSDPAVLYTVGGDTRHTIQGTELDTILRRTRDILNLDHLGLGMPLTSKVASLGTSDESLVACFGGEHLNDHMYCGVLLEREDMFAYLIDTRREPGLGPVLLRAATIDRSGRWVVMQLADSSLVVWDTYHTVYTPIP